MSHYGSDWRRTSPRGACQTRPMDLRIVHEPSVDAAASIARRLRDAVRRRGAATVALSGGSTAPPMIDALIAHDVPWASVTIFQVDERIVPDGHDARNAGQLSVLRAMPCEVRLMPVTVGDLRAGARRYGRALPGRIDVVHLGLGEDGHTASWPPGRPDVPDAERQVELVPSFNGFDRMTLTRSVVNAARSRVVLTTGVAKRPMVERWLSGDRSLPVSSVRRSSTTVFLDDAAAPRTSLH